MSFKEFLQESTGESIKVHGEFNWKAFVGGENVNKKIEFAISVTKTGSGKIKYLNVYPTDSKYYNFHNIGRSMSATIEKREVEHFLKNGYTGEFFVLPNNDYNKEKGLAGALSFKIDPKDLEPLKELIK